ncbi:16S rRNA (guanine(966)-N(2))-methyltransferase RsmD [Microbacterium sp. Marseille-Q6965]|uniref:16S rRNA (guanine(966)-N(2))-methyltransferase RsmD n=1 Tax=Microbacterium sp. Marseille-Q6965 TaxID=2965072 RepID=UPI0021B80A45|nr:16S rRNA (guanine(966)-N(2))-methyltransferase RsmD [Microbacterium sp. Marseille-Q6965]
MTRIIAGAARGVRLDVPDAGTRPTSDRVRESLFGALDTTGLLEATTVVDLYAGSGALGLEALSRGAAAVDLVERAPRAARVVRTNAARVAKAAGREATVHASSVQAFLRGAQRTYDLAFLDPPYDVPDDAVAEDLRLLAPLLAPDAIVIVERASRSASPDWAAAGLASLRERTYGDTALWWGEPRHS